MLVKTLTIYGFQNQLTAIASFSKAENMIMQRNSIISETDGTNRKQAVGSPPIPLESLEDSISTPSAEMTR